MKYHNAIAIIAVFIAGMVAAPTVDAADIVYNDFYKHFNGDSSLVKDGRDGELDANGTDDPDAEPDDTASWAYAANDADGFGGIARFDAPENHLVDLATGSVIMSNWHGHDTSRVTDGVATQGYSHPFTLELYEVDRSGAAPAVGALIDAVTEMHTVPGRQIPGDDNFSFVGLGTDFVMDFDLTGITVPEEVLFMLSFDTSTREELGQLNIAALAGNSTNDAEATVGIAPADDVFWRSSATGGDIERFEGGPVFSRFTGTVIPEPASVTLLALGGLALLRRRA